MTSHDHLPPSFTPPTLSGYRLLRSLGRGRLGEVHVARDLDTGEHVALRLVPPEQADRPELRVRLERWHARAARLDHPGLLVPGCRLDASRGFAYVMPLARGGSARQLLQQAARDDRPLELALVLDVIRQTARALHHLHEQGWTHANLKPENLLLDAAPHASPRPPLVRLSDHALGELELRESVMHRPWLASSYLSPEQCRGARPDPRTDVYVLGIILYELLTGLVPFEARDAATAAAQHLHAAPRPPSELRPDLPTGLEAVILACLAKDPAHRPPSVLDVEHALAEVHDALLPRGPGLTLVEADRPGPPPTVDVPDDACAWPRLLVADVTGRVLRVVRLDAGTVTVGREARSTLVLDAPTVSRQHLRLDVNHDGIQVTNLSDTNPARLAGRALPRNSTHSWPAGLPLGVGSCWLIQIPPRGRMEPRLTVALDAPELHLVPGEARRLTVRLANTGRTVDHLTVGVEGVPDGWIVKRPSDVQLFPGEGADVVLEVLVPRVTESAAGPREVRVVARSRENPDESGEARATWYVAPFTETTVGATPSVRRVWRTARFHVEVRNGGNVPLVIHPEVREAIPAEPGRRRTAAHFAPLPTEVGVAPGEIHALNVTARLPWLWLGGVRRRTLHLRGTGSHETPVELQVDQRPLLPLHLLPLLALLVLGVLTWLSRPPTVVAFTSIPAEPRVGERVTLTWETRGARRVRIEPFGHEVRVTPEGRGELVLDSGVREATRLYLTARGPFARSGGTLTLTPRRPPPRVVRFEASTARVVAGQEVTLRWDVRNVDRVQLDPLGTQPARGEARLRVANDTRVRLVAGDGNDTVTRTLEVGVVGPTIARFEVAPTEADLGSTVRVRWQVASATDVTLAPLGTVPPRGERTLDVTGDTTLTLTASGGGRSVTLSRTIRLRPPTVELFTATPERPRPGESVTLRWRVRGARDVSLGPVGTVPPEGQTRIVPPPGTTVELSASNGQDSVRATVRVNPAVTTESGPLVPAAPTVATASPAAPPAPDASIDQFEVDPPVAAPGAPVRVRWATRDATRVVLVVDGQAPREVEAAGTADLVAGRAARGVRLVAVSAGGARVERRLELVLRASAPTPRPRPVRAPVPLVVSEFRVQPSSAEPGSRVRVRWKVTGTPDVRLSPLPGAQKAEGEVEVTVARETTFILATPQGRELARRTVTLRAPTPMPAPVAPRGEDRPAPATIERFEASATSVPRGTPVTLVWEVRDAVRVTISGLGPVEPGGSLTRTIDRPTTLVLRAEGANGRVVTREVRVETVVPPPPPSPVDGLWQHPFGQLDLRVRGTTVTGTFRDDRSGREGRVTGRLSRGASSTLNLGARVEFDDEPGQSVAFVVAFDDRLTTFSGPYSTRVARERWCGWRPEAGPPEGCVP